MNFTHPIFLYKKYTYQNSTQLTKLPVNITSNYIYKSQFNTQHNHSLKTKTFTTLNMSLLGSANSNFIYLKYNFFNSFFTNSYVEVPKVFINFKALVRPVNQITLYKFSNYLTLHGKFVKSVLLLNYSWYKSIQVMAASRSKNITHWTHLYHLITNYNTINVSKSSPNTTHKYSLKTLITRFIREYQPIFTLYIYKISKNIYKNTRGKSGKFMFILKYVPVYKRFSIITSWVIKELRVIPQRELKLRLLQLLIQLVQTPSKTWVSRIKQFSYNYVYRNCSKTLATNYRSVKA